MCKTDNPQRVTFPKEDHVEFKNHQRQQRVPFTLYADFEAVTEKLTPPNRPSKYTRYQQHVPCGYSIVGVQNCCGSSKIIDRVTYRGEETVKHFLNTAITLADKYQKAIDSPAKLFMTQEDRREFDDAVATFKPCHICKLPLQSDKVTHKDHCHM